MDAAAHWDRIYGTKDDREVSWFEPNPAMSLQVLHEAGLTASTCIVDIGGGNSRLVDALLSEGLQRIAVLDVSAVAVARARARLGSVANRVTWIVGDVTGDWSLAPVDVWHDRAVFHFLTTADERARYVAHVRKTLRLGGSAVLATFSLEGPEKCSGLPVVRYSPETLAAEIGSGFALVAAHAWTHQTPWGTSQAFQYSTFRRVE